MVDAEAAVEAGPALGHVGGVVRHLAVHGLVDRAPLAPLDALLLECSDGHRVDGLTCVPRGAKGSGRDEPFLDLPRWSADAVEADTHERAATMRPNVACHRMLDLTGHHGLVPVAKLQLTARRELQDAIHYIATVGRDPRATRECTNEYAKWFVDLRKGEGAGRLDEPPCARHVALLLASLL